jgi:type IV pilus biogenesis protein CpaD/CtpE
MMRALLVPTIALAMSASSAAFAQSPPASGQQQSSSQSSQPMSTRGYKEVENALTQAGIQNVRTLNAAYLVSAVTKEGEQVTFVVDPPASTGTTASGGVSSSGSSQQSASSAQQGSAQPSGSSSQQMALRSQQQVRDSLTKAGFTKVQILDAAYLATGKTQNGDMITMMIDPSAQTGATGSAGSGGQMNTGQGGSATKP